ncbi:zinc ribbon domain-containing protein [Eubacteriaceae bacterium ES2]|nr:zinc ribbon domain-containing protein [Eubacteriaceae bacterium ES2]
MLKSFTRNYEDNSTEAGFQFTFYCDICEDGYRSSFVESESTKKNSFLKGFGEGVSALGNMFGGKLGDIGRGMERGTSVLSERFNGMSAEWQKEHERAFEMAQNEARQHFHRCHGCHQWVCDADFNEIEGLCVECSPLESVSVSKAKAQAMQRNLDEAAESQTVWEGKLETQTIVCPQCGKPAGSGKFCNNCGAKLGGSFCTNCGATLPDGARFCSECGTKA